MQYLTIIILYYISFSYTLYYYSLSGDSVGNSRAQALAKELNHCANIKELK